MTSATTGEAVTQLRNYIDGQFVDWRADDAGIDSFNPATGRVHLRMPSSGESEVNAAVAAAKRAFRG